MHFCCTPSVLHAPPIFVQCRVLTAGAVLLWVLTCRTSARCSLQITIITIIIIIIIIIMMSRPVVTYSPPSFPRPTNRLTFCSSVAVGKQLKAVAFNIFKLWFMSLCSSVRKAAHIALGDQHSIAAGRERCECLYSCSVRAANIQEVQYHAVFIDWCEMRLHVSAKFGLYPVIADDATATGRKPSCS